MPTFFRRRYGRPADRVSGLERTIAVVIVIALIGLGAAVGRALTVRVESDALQAFALANEQGASGAAPVSAANKADASGDKPYQPFALPELDQSGWTGPHSKQSFSPERVHEKINGRDGLYLDYGLVGMTFATYKHPKSDDHYVDVYVYDMGDPLNAFGCYKAEFARGMPDAKIGRGSYKAEHSIFYWKGDCYVQLMAGDALSESDDKVVRQLAERIASKINDDGTELWGDKLLPKANRVPESLGYERKNGFSLDFLRKVFRADYEDGEQMVTLFIHKAASPEAAQATLARYAAYLKKHGKILSEEETPGGKTIVGEVLDLFDVVFCKGAYLGGANGAESAESAKKHAVTFRESLTTK